MGANHSAHTTTTSASSQPAVAHQSRTSLSVRSAPTPRSSGLTSRPELSRTGVIRNAVNVQKSSIVLKPSERTLEFKFDASVSTSFKIHFNVTEFLDEMKVPILASDLNPVTSDVFPSGLDQVLKVPSIPLTNPHRDNVYSAIIETLPCFPTNLTAEEKDSCASQLTYLSINEEPLKVSVVKQKLRYGERGYELHEIFGRERNAGDKSPNSPARDLEDLNATDCVICLSNPRDTTIIPCLHLCLCSQCAQVLSLNTRKCPVCRTPATGLLHIDRDLPPPSPTSPRSPKLLNKQV